MPIPVLFQNGDMIVCVKAPGLSSEQGGLPDLLREQCGGAVYPVHRLDAGVGGVMVYARNREAAAALSAQIAARRMEKEYLAVVEGRPGQKNGELRDLLFHDRQRNKSYVVQRMRKGVREASLDYRLLETAETEQGAASAGTSRSGPPRCAFPTRRTHRPCSSAHSRPRSGPGRCLICQIMLCKEFIL